MKYLSILAAFKLVFYLFEDGVGIGFHNQELQVSHRGKQGVERMSGL